MCLWINQWTMSTSSPLLVYRVPFTDWIVLFLFLGNVVPTFWVSCSSSVLYICDPNGRCGTDTSRNFSILMSLLQGNLYSPSLSLHLRTGDRIKSPLLNTAISNSAIYVFRMLRQNSESEAGKLSASFWYFLLFFCWRLQLTTTIPDSTFSP